MMSFFKTFYLKVDRFVNEYLIQAILSIFLLVASVVILWPYIVKVIPAGSAGVLFRPIGGGVNTDYVYGEGVHIVFPWDTMTVYSGRIQKRNFELEVMTKDLLKSKVVIAYQYQINEATLPLLHKFIGPNYVEVVVEPFVINAVRQRFAEFDSSNAFTIDLRSVINDVAITANDVLVEKINPPGLEFIKLIRIPSAEVADIQFPEIYAKSIQEKLVQKSKSEAYTFVLESAKQEAVRKEIEAEGIRKFQDIVRPGLSEGYLRWKGIEATQKLAESENAKIVMFGSGAGGLPLILNDENKGKGKQ